MDFIELLKVIFLGLVQGITEWLPVSSTGHMILVDELLAFSYSPAFREVFFVVIQFGSILAVVFLFWNKIFPITLEDTLKIDLDKIQLWVKIAVACLPAAVIGLLFDEVLDELFFNYQTVALMLILHGIIFIVVENRNQQRQPKINDLTQITYQAAIMIGIFQLLALLPGTSRSGATIIGAMLIGSSRHVASEFTFFLAIPVMFGASLLKIARIGLAFTTSEWLTLGVGTVTAFMISIITIKFLLNYIKRNDFKPFGYYRIILGIIVIAYFHFIS